MQALELKIKQTIEAAFANETERVIEQSKAVLVARLKEALANIAIQMANKVNLETYGQTIVVTLDFTDIDKTLDVRKNTRTLH